MCLAPLYLDHEVKTIKNFLCGPLGPECPYGFVWCLKTSGRNLGSLQRHVIISKEPKCRVILTPIKQKMP